MAVKKVLWMVSLQVERWVAQSVVSLAVGRDLLSVATMAALTAW